MFCVGDWRGFKVILWGVVVICCYGDLKFDEFGSVCALIHKYEDNNYELGEL